VESHSICYLLLWSKERLQDSKDAADKSRRSRQRCRQGSHASGHDYGVPTTSDRILDLVVMSGYVS